MQQSNVIFGALLVAFIVFVTLRGELPVYIDLLRGGGSISSSGNSNAGSGNNPATTGGALGTELGMLYNNVTQLGGAPDPGIQLGH